MDFKNLFHILNTQYARIICEKYLSNGCRIGGNWHVANINNGIRRHAHKQGSMVINLTSGKWTDFATGEKGDIFDIIRHYSVNNKAAYRRAAEFVNNGVPAHSKGKSVAPLQPPSVIDGEYKAKNYIGLCRAAKPVINTLAQKYLNSRQIYHYNGLYFHPAIFAGNGQKSPALLTPLCKFPRPRNANKFIIAVHVIFLNSEGGKNEACPIPKKIYGRCKDSHVFIPSNSLEKDRGKKTALFCEGLETGLSVSQFFDNGDLFAALTATNLQSLKIGNMPFEDVDDFSKKYEKVIIVQDNDMAGEKAAMSFYKNNHHIMPIKVITSEYKDFNDDLCELGKDRFISILKEKCGD